jgi:hypothetical protein
MVQIDDPDADLSEKYLTDVGIAMPFRELRTLINLIRRSICAAFGVWQVRHDLIPILSDVVYLSFRVSKRCIDRILPDDRSCGPIVWRPFVDTPNAVSNLR